MNIKYTVKHNNTVNHPRKQILDFNCGYEFLYYKTVIKVTGVETITVQSSVSEQDQAYM